MESSSDDSSGSGNTNSFGSFGDSGAEVTPEVLQDIRNIVDSFKPNENFKCIECAQKIEDYLKEKNIRGERVKLDTPKQTRYDDYIYDDSLPAGSDAISTNGHHEGIAIRINGEERVFDNHHTDGVPTEQWKNNLVFDRKVRFGANFKEERYQF